MDVYRTVEPSPGLSLAPGHVDSHLAAWRTKSAFACMCGRPRNLRTRNAFPKPRIVTEDIGLDRGRRPRTPTSSSRHARPPTISTLRALAAKSGISAHRRPSSASTTNSPRTTPADLLKNVRPHRLDIGPLPTGNRNQHPRRTHRREARQGERARREPSSRKWRRRPVVYC